MGVLDTVLKQETGGQEAAPRDVQIDAVFRASKDSSKVGVLSCGHDVQRFMVCKMQLSTRTGQR